MSSPREHAAPSNDIVWRRRTGIVEDEGERMSFVVVNLEHNTGGAPYAAGNFNVTLPTKLFNVARIDIDSLIVSGVTHTANVPDQPYVTMSLDGFALVGDQGDTLIVDADHTTGTLVNNSSVASGYPIVYQAAPIHAESYDSSGPNRQRPFFTARSSQTSRPIESLRISIKGPAGAAPEFGRLTMRLCVHQHLNADAPKATPFNADRLRNIGGISQASDMRRRKGIEERT